MSDPSAGSVTIWLGDLQGGEPEAIRKLWERYFQSLVQVAAGQLRGAARGMADEEDVALNVFDSVCRRAAAGKLAGLDGRDDLWRVLMVIARQKSIDHRRHESRQKRGGGTTVREVQPSGATADSTGLDEFLGTDSPPDEIASIREELAALLKSLPDANLPSIAVGKLEGRTNDEIAAQLNVTPRTVERKQLIRSLWLDRIGQAR